MYNYSGAYSIAATSPGDGGDCATKARASHTRGGRGRYKLPPMIVPPDTSPLLESIQLPEDLRQLPTAKLPELADELRQFLIQSVSTRGGHFAAGLGTVELTIALHYVYDTPRDRLVA